MAFQVSPGVNVSEIDLTGAVVAASTSIGGTVMPARWGPANTVQTISSEEEMLATFGNQTQQLRIIGSQPHLF